MAYNKDYKPPVKRNILLNPGPATTTDTVKYAQVVPDICPREKEFSALIENIREELTRFVGEPDEYSTVPLGGSGTAAVEAMLSSFVDDTKILIVNNGAYGKRMVEISDIYGLNRIEFKSPETEPINLEELSKVIDSEKDIRFLAVVHHETTTGLLNDLPSLGKICHDRKIKLLVDAVSSFAAVPIDMSTMHVACLASCSNKNLQGIAGVVFVVAEKNLLNKDSGYKARTLYLDLKSQYQGFVKTGQFRFTPPVQVLYALRQAIIETQQETVEGRYKRYAHSWETLIEGIQRLGLKHLVSKAHHGKMITAITEPDCPGYQFNDMHDFLFARGITIYPGKLGNQKTFRVANIGEISAEDIETFLKYLSLYLDKIGF